MLKQRKKKKKKLLKDSSIGLGLGNRILDSHIAFAACKSEVYVHNLISETQISQLLCLQQPFTSIDFLKYYDSSLLFDSGLGLWNNSILDSRVEFVGCKSEICGLANQTLLSEVQFSQLLCLQQPLTSIDSLVRYDLSLLYDSGDSGHRGGVFEILG